MLIEKRVYHIETNLETRAEHSPDEREVSRFTTMMRRDVRQGNALCDTRRKKRLQKLNWFVTGTGKCCLDQMSRAHLTTVFCGR